MVVSMAATTVVLMVVHLGEQKAVRLVAAMVGWTAALLDAHMVGHLADSRADVTAVRSVLTSALVEVAS